MAAGEEDKRQPWVISVRIPRHIEPRLRQLAQRRVVPPAILLRQLIVERLEQVERENQGRLS